MIDVMARKVSVVTTDDLDGSPEAAIVSFGLDGVSYEIDLAAANKTRLANLVAPADHEPIPAADGWLQLHHLDGPGCPSASQCRRGRSRSPAGCRPGRAGRCARCRRGAWMAGPCWHAGSCGWSRRPPDGRGDAVRPGCEARPRSGSPSPGARSGRPTPRRSADGPAASAAATARRSACGASATTFPAWQSGGRVAPSEASGQARPGPRDPARTGEASDCSVAAQRPRAAVRVSPRPSTPTTERTGQARTAPEQRAYRSDEQARSPIIDVTISRSLHRQ